jgi:phosphatidate cytidylyltransferase
MSELSKRIIVAAVAIPIAFFVMYLGRIAFALVISIISSLALWEFYKMAEKKNYPTFKIFGIIFGIIPVFLYLFCNILHLFFIVFIAFVVGILILSLLSKRENIIAGIGVMFAGFFYISLSFFSLISLRSDLFIEYFIDVNNNENFGFYLVSLIFCSVWICDSAAYFIGRKFGKHKLLERVSPKKTIEGAAAGFLASALFFPILSHFLMPEFNLIYAIIFGIVIGIFGQIGDLIESKLKRDAGVKDSSNLIPGHGGILDRFDSIIFISPILLGIIILLF